MNTLHKIGPQAYFHSRSHKGPTSLVLNNLQGRPSSSPNSVLQASTCSANGLCCPLMDSTSHMVLFGRNSLSLRSSLHSQQLSSNGDTLTAWQLLCAKEVWFFLAVQRILEKGSCSGQFLLFGPILSVTQSTVRALKRFWHVLLGNPCGGVVSKNLLLHRVSANSTRLKQDRI